ncbi:Putative transposase of IS4/5 family [Nitrosomonas eutropha]|nr:Putative transposase of IS4/5 family [Nitrosomonas eutropha]
MPDVYGLCLILNLSIGLNSVYLLLYISNGLLRFNSRMNRDTVGRQRMESYYLGKADDPGRSGTSNRQFVEACFWITHCGSLWRDLPAAFGKWNTISSSACKTGARFGVFKRITLRCNKTDYSFSSVIYLLSIISAPSKSQ